MTEEIWKKYPDNHDYEVSSLGRVRSLDRFCYGFKKRITKRYIFGKIIIPERLDYGYLRISIQKHSEKKRVLVHRLVLETFVGKCPEGLQCAHLNGNASDNRLENLKWCSLKENAGHRLLHGTMLIGESHRSATITEKEVKIIRSFFGKLSQRKIAAKLNISRNTIKKILEGKTWKHVS